jgi:hypothetical protein
MWSHMNPFITGVIIHLLGEAQGRSFSFTSPWTALAPIVLALLLRGRVRNTSALLISTTVFLQEKDLL